MVLPKECLTDFKELYEKANNLVNEESKTDPPTSPYRSHYAAKDVLLQLKDRLEEALTQHSENAADKQILTIIMAFVCRDLGRIDVFTEEFSSGEKQFKTCLQLVEPYKLLPAGIIPYVGALNELGVVQSHHQDYKQANEFLQLSEKSYLDFKGTAENALAITDVFGTPEEIEVGKGNTKLESLYIHCAFYLAQNYGYLGELEKSAQYCHLTLKRQLIAKSYEAIDFSLNAATLSQYFIGKNMFKAARHHLAAATLIMAEHEVSMLKPEMTEQQREDVTETFRHRYADVARCWAKYGLALLSASKDRLLNDDEDKLAEDVKQLNVNDAEFSFPQLQLSAYEDRVSCDYCLTFEDAKLIYHFVINWLDQAKDYYKPDTEATEYAKIIKDYAELYQYIAFFEEDPVNQSKMHKRRAKYYEDLLELLNPLFYLSICRECWFGAGLAHSAILDIRLDALTGNRTPGPQELQKINQACQKAIKHYKDFLQTYLEKDGITLKSISDEDELRPVLYAYFYLGRLYYKLISADQAVQLENLQNSLFYNKKFTEECDAREKIAEGMRAEVGVCREMVNLLPLKINNLQKRK